MEDKSSSSLKISVILTAYNRKQFLPSSLESIIKQTIDRDKYEIIVIKNFEDEAIDKTISDIGAIHIKIGKCSVGEMLQRAIFETSGDVISFLEDDDLFFPDKLSAVYDKFMKKPDLIFYHNADQPIQSDGTPINSDFNKFPDKYLEIDCCNEVNQDLFKLLNMNMAGNPSLMSIKKYVLLEKLENLKHIERAPDIFLFFASLMPGKKIAIDNRRLTYIRHHDENTSKARGNYLISSQKRKSFVRYVKMDREYTAEIISDSKTREIFEKTSSWIKVEDLLISDVVDRPNMFKNGLKYFKHNYDLRKKIPPFFIFIFLTYFILPYFSKNLYKIYDWMKRNKEWVGLNMV